jgi:integrase
MPGITKVAKMLRRDLEAAEIPYKDQEERVVDFHALRHTYATNLARSGVHPKIAMDLLDHSNINLTMAYYSHTDVKERAAALGGLPSLVGD